MSRYFPEDPDVLAARRADPNWRSEQERKRNEASERFVAYRESVGMPVVQKKEGERF